MQEKIKGILKKIQNCSCFQKGGILGPESPDCTRVKIPFFKMALGPFSLVLDNPRVFFSLSLVYALLITLLALMFGFSYLCVYSSSGEVVVSCANSHLLYFTYFILKLYILSLFCIKWCETAIRKLPLAWTQLFSADRRSIKLTLLFVFFLLLNSTPFFSGLILYFREPNPDWRVETAFFAVVSVGFLIPLFLVRFYSVFAFFIYGQSLPNLRELWRKNTGNNLNLLSGLFLIIILAMILFSSLYQNFTPVAHENSFYIAFVSEYLYNFLSMLLIACFADYCCIQQQLIYNEPPAEGCEKQ